MLNVMTATKNSYLTDSGDKQLTITFPDLDITLTNEDLHQEDFELIEAVNSGDSIEFIGCIASQLKFTATSITEDIKKEYMEVSICCNETEDIPLFQGFVEEVEQVPHKLDKKITAYDVLYELQQVNVADWYRLLTFPISIKDFRDSLFDELGIEQVSVTLPLDSIIIQRNYNPTEMVALDLIKSLCQINCVFGRINRYGEFEYLFPPQTETVSQAITYYKSADYQEYMVDPVDKLIIRSTKQGDFIYGGGTNKYIIQDNFFMTNLTDEQLQSIANTLYPYIEGFTYQPFEADVNGLPYVECLDYISLPVRNLSTEQYVTKPFLVLERTISGIQGLRDGYVAEGDEYQHEFVTSIEVDIEELRQAMEVIRNDLENLGFKYYMITNTAQIDIGDGETKNIVNLRFQATKKTVTVFNAEILLEGDSTVDGINYDDIKGLFTYILDDVEIVDYKPKEVWFDGEHIAHLLYYFNIQDSTMKHLIVTLNSQGGSITIPTARIKASLYGQNLYATDNWDGILFVEEDMGGKRSVINTELSHTNTMNEVVGSGYYPITPKTMGDNMYNMKATLGELTITTSMQETFETGGE